MTIMHQIGLSAATALLFATGGCGSAGPATPTAEIRSNASEAAKREAEARMDATYERDQARKRAIAGQTGGAPPDAAAARIAAHASAELNHTAALLRCNGQPEDSRSSCKERAESEFATANARADAST